LALSPSVRLERLNGLLSFTENRIGRVPELATPLVRRCSRLNSLQARNRCSRLWICFQPIKMEQENFQSDLQKLSQVGLFYHDERSSNLTLCLERCEKLYCPQLSLQVFGNFAKYQLALTPLAGRWLINSPYVQHPISSTSPPVFLFRRLSYTTALSRSTACQWVTSATLIFSLLFVSRVCSSCCLTRRRGRKSC